MTGSRRSIDGDRTVSPPPAPPSVPRAAFDDEPLPVHEPPASEARPLRRRSSASKLISWLVGGVVGVGLAIVLLKFGLGRDPFGLFGSQPVAVSPKVDDAASAPGANAESSASKVDSPIGESSANPIQVSSEAEPPSAVAAADVGAAPSPSAPEPSPPTASDPVVPAPQAPPFVVVEEPEPLPVPSYDAQNAVLFRLDEIFHVAPHIPASQAEADARAIAIAKQMLDQATGSTDDPVVRYVLLKRANDLAIDVGSLDTARRATAELKRWFIVDGLAYDGRLIQGLAKADLDEPEERQVAADAVQLANDLIEAKRFAEAELTANVAATLAARVRDIALVRGAENATKDIATRREAWEEARAAETKLRKSPNAPVENRVWGAYVCLEDGDWEKGLPLLAKGDDPKLRDAASRDIAAEDPLAKVGAADIWYELSREEGGDPRFLSRARRLYSDALGGLEGLDRIKPEARLREVAPSVYAAKRYVNTLGMEMALIPAGEFLMGTGPSYVADQSESGPLGKPEIASERPQHLVRISRSFYLASRETTERQFREFADATHHTTRREQVKGPPFPPTPGPMTPFPPTPGPMTPPPFLPGNAANWRSPGFPHQDNHPVVFVEWDEAVEFAKWLSDKEGRRYRLPTEAEWEYACRAGSTSLYSFGDDPSALVRFGNVADAKLNADVPAYPYRGLAESDGWAYTSPVGTFAPNAFGLYDMHGNVWEWCSDGFDRLYYVNSPLLDPKGSTNGTARAFRGGSFDSRAFDCRSATRRATLERTVSRPNLGFRLACEVPTGLEGIAAAVVPVTPEPVDARDAIPSPEEQATAKKRLEEIYATEFAGADSSARKSDLATMLLNRVDDLADDSVARFVVLRTARDLAIDAGNGKVARSASGRLADLYRVDPTEVEAHLIAALAETAATDNARKEVAKQALDVARRSMEGERFDEAERLIQVAMRLAVRIRDAELHRRAAVLANENKTGRKVSSTYSQAQKTLAAAPDDPAANEVAGRYLCIHRGDWEAGLASLAKSDDPTLADAAAKDLAGPADAAGRLAVADAWFEVGQVGGDDVQFLFRARRWYGMALEGLTGLDKLHAEKRQAAIEEMVPVEVGPEAEGPEDANPTKEPTLTGNANFWASEYIGRVITSGLARDSHYGALFGGRTRQNGEVENAVFKYAQGRAVHFVQWDLKQPAAISRVSIRVKHDPGDEPSAAASAVRVYGYDFDAREFRLLFEHALAFPYRETAVPTQGGISRLSNSEIEIDGRFPTVTTRRFRIEFVQAGDPAVTYAGVRVVEVEASGR